jgi:hypothetical protein
MELIKENGKKTPGDLKLDLDIIALIGRVAKNKDRLVKFGLQGQRFDNILNHAPLKIMYRTDCTEQLAALHFSSNQTSIQLHFAPVYLEIPSPLRLKAAAHEIGHWLLRDSRPRAQLIFSWRQEEHLADTIADILVPEISMGTLYSSLYAKKTPQSTGLFDAMLDDMKSLTKMWPSENIRAHLSEGRLSGKPAFYYYNAITDVTGLALTGMGMKDLADKAKNWRVPD